MINWFFKFFLTIDLKSNVVFNHFNRVRLKSNQLIWLILIIKKKKRRRLQPQYEEYENEETTGRRSQDSVPVGSSGGNPHQLIKQFDQDGIHVPLSILRAFSPLRNDPNPTRSAKSISQTKTVEGEMTMDDQQYFHPQSEHSNVYISFIQRLI